jgi:pyruvate formate-lyase activating enzyme-like uncharacterized protein
MKLDLILIYFGKKRSSFRNGHSEIKLAREFFAQKNVGVEMPMIPDRKNDFLNLIIRLKEIIGL